jgi:uncharacterized protein
VVKISVKVKPNAREVRVEKTGESEYTVRVKAPAKEGRANAAVVEAISLYFEIPKSRVRLTHGQSGRKKTFEIV